jgi:hypothetical protein
VAALFAAGRGLMTFRPTVQTFATALVYGFNWLGQ